MTLDSSATPFPSSPDTVRWSRPLGEYDRRRLAPWAAGVGAPAFGSAPAGLAPAVSGLAILSWNLHVGYGELERLVDHLRRGLLTGGTPVPHFVVLLQEARRVGAWRIPLGITAPRRIGVPAPAGPRPDVVEAARELGLAFLYVPSMLNGAGADGVAEDRGNAILSTLPLADPHAVELPFEAQRRVAVHASVRGETSRGEVVGLEVASVHLDHRSAGARLWASLGSGRARQARALIGSLPLRAPSVVAGDLNCWALGAAEGAVRTLRRRLTQSPPAPAGSTFSTALGFRRRLDHMFFHLPAGWRVACERVADRYGSDHHPLLARISIDER